MCFDNEAGDDSDDRNDVDDVDLMSDEEEGEKVEEVDNLQYEIMPPSSNESDYSLVNGEYNAFSDFVSRHFMQRFSQLDLSRLFYIPFFSNYNNDTTAISSDR